MMRIATLRALRHAVAVSALTILLALGSPAGAAPPPKGDLRYLPADCQFVLMLRVDQALANRDFLEMPREAKLGTFSKLEIARGRSRSAAGSDRAVPMQSSALGRGPEVGKRHDR
jgi:hypothetical protein